MPPLHRFTLVVLIPLILAGCQSAESAVATAMAGTAEQQAIEALIRSATAAAGATNTPTATPTRTPTATVTETPTPTRTPLPPAGMDYLPDFIGLSLAEAQEILDDNEFNYIYIVLINRGVPEWTVYEQDPAPATLVDRHDDRVRIYVAVYEFTPTPPPAPRHGSPSGDPCGGVTYAGFCDGVYCIWCEDNQLWYIDCLGWCGGTCGFDPSDRIYKCFCP